MKFGLGRLFRALTGNLWILTLCCSANAATPAGRQFYVPATSTCDGFPRAAIEMAPGLCAGLVLAPQAGGFHERQLKTPRVLLQLQDDSRWLVSDLGGWTAGQGKLWLLLVNVGAATDQCADGAKSSATVGCPEANGDEARAVIRRYPYLGNGRWEQQSTIVARGLRNSLVLLRHSSGTLLQAENSYDFAPTADRPYDEINVIRNGAHYGWPYCYDIDQATPAWASLEVMDCGSVAHEKPVALLPPHSAPLGAVYYQGGMFASLRGKLLMSWHGYRPTGSRIVAFDVDSQGVPVPATQPTYPKYLDNGGVALEPYRAAPAAMPMVLTPGWDLKVGARPAGAPVGISVARDGALWVADDRNAAILRFAVDRP